jgi:spore germination cell wall hydrolase CwlJ-like protein
VLEYNEEKDRYVQRSMAAQQALDAKAVEAGKKEAAKAERAKKARFDRITTLLDLSQPEYRAMRKTNFFAQAKNTEASNFHRKEQELIFKEIYEKLTKYKVCP